MANTVPRVFQDCGQVRKVEILAQYIPQSATVVSPRWKRDSVESRDMFLNSLDVSFQTQLSL